MDMEGHSSTVFSASFSPNGTKVVSGSDDQTVRIIVSSASFSPDGTKVVSGSDDRTVRIWDMKALKQGN